MSHGTLQKRIFWLFAIMTAFCLATPIPGYAQRGAGPQRGGGPRPTARGSAPIDLSGYWVSVISEDWKFRMVTPSKGMLEPLPLNGEGRRVANEWDPARDQASGEACRAYGAAGIMRVPGRLHLTWQDDNTLRLDIDAGTQTRLFHFGDAPVPPAGRSWQGHSIAAWELTAGGRGAARAGNLKVVTTHMLPGYVRKNGAPYSESAVLTEYYDLHTLPNGDQWLTITTIVDNPQYFSRPYITTSDFKKLPDGSGWNPTPCSAS